jgi:hypothetical protein
MLKRKGEYKVKGRVKLKEVEEIQRGTLHAKQILTILLHLPVTPQVRGRHVFDILLSDNQL